MDFYGKTNCCRSSAEQRMGDAGGSIPTNVIFVFFLASASPHIGFAAFGQMVD